MLLSEPAASKKRGRGVRFGKRRKKPAIMESETEEQEWPAQDQAQDQVQGQTQAQKPTPKKKGKKKKEKEKEKEKKKTFVLMDDALFKRESQITKHQAKARSKERKKRAEHAPFIVRYRPTSLDQVSGHRPTIQRLKVYVQHGSTALPNLMFDGPPGTGKTTCGTCIGNELLKDCKSRAFFWLNASDSRSATFVSTELRAFVKKKITLPPNTCRIVFLDEVDSMTHEAQRLLKRTVESCRTNARFILACNDSSRVIESLQAICTIFRFKPLQYEAVSSKLREVATAESIHLTPDGLAALIKITDGDMRRGLNALQTCKDQMTIGTQAEQKMSLDGPTIFRLCDVPDDSVLESVLLSCASNNVKRALEKVKNMLDKGMAVDDLLKSLHQLLRAQSAGERAGQPGHYSSCGAKLDRLLSAEQRHAVLQVISRYLSKGRDLHCFVLNEATQAAPLRTRLQLFACIGGITDTLNRRRK